MEITETVVHIAARQALKQNGWQLLAGQFPGGSDDELVALNVVDPAVARDQSPDPSRHSVGKLVPDIVAIRSEILLVVEAKPTYSVADREKLIYLLGDRRGDFDDALSAHCTRVHAELPQAFELVPCLAFAAGVVAPWPDGDFAHIRVHDLSNAILEMPPESGAPT